MILPSPLGWISAKQSPPIPVDCGSITARIALAATAASAAVPPDLRTSTAVSAASGCDVATMAFRACTVERPARWKFLMDLHFVLRDSAAARRKVRWHGQGLQGNARNRMAAIPAPDVGDRYEPFPAPPRLI